jgi:hypothetical protein
MAVQKQFPRTARKHDYSTGLAWVGAPADWTDKEDWELSTDEFGASTLQRDYWLRADRPIEEALPIKNQYDAQFPTLLVFDFRVRGDGAFNHLTVRSNGFLDKSPPEQKRERKQFAIRDQTLYASQIVGNDRIVGLAEAIRVSYIAPSVVRRWSSPVEPIFQDRYEDKSFDEDCQIIGFVLTDGVIADLSDFKRLMAAFDIRRQQRSIRTQLDVDKEGAVYRVTEVVERQIIQEPTFKAMFL